MTEEEMVQYLEDNGYPEHVRRGGSDGLIKRYREFVEEVERGYRFGLEDYRNDLDLRGILSLVDLDAKVLELDERFNKMLTAHDKRVWETSGDNPFWDFGYPRNASGDLRADLKAEGLWED
jgi:hypothetical protein